MHDNVLKISLQLIYNVLCSSVHSPLPMAKRPIQVRIDEKLKKQVEKILKRVGLNTSTAIRIYFKKIALTGGIPFDLRGDLEAPPESWQFPWTQKEIYEAMRESRDPKNVYGPFDSVDEMFDHLKSNKECN